MATSFHDYIHYTLYLLGWEAGRRNCQSTKAISFPSWKRTFAYLIKITCTFTSLPDGAGHSTHHRQCMNDVHILLVQLPSLEGSCDRRNLVVHHILQYLTISLATNRMIKNNFSASSVCNRGYINLHTYTCMRVCEWVVVCVCVHACVSTDVCVSPVCCQPPSGRSSNLPQSISPQ